ncbi:tyrosine-protein phosphatase [Kitasatospora sp. NPDC002227]|uniref:tyrosine-protein phosphatase n=1 Tax=Kitasatospora sp. NPDC002227 TaxID=3154773 RepID=UPI00331792CD
MIRHLEFQRLRNFRDLGGYPAADGRTVRWGRLYRSDSLGKLNGAAEADRAAFLELGIRTVIDLRYPWEIEGRGRVPESYGVEYHNLSIEHRPYDQEALGAEFEVVPFLAEKFAEVAADGVEELRQVLRLVAEADNAPLVFHCAAGKDRTGIVAALLLTLLGVGEEDIVADFALTGLATENLIADWRANNPGKSPRWPGFAQAPADLMRSFLADLTARHGSVAGYATEQLEADADLVAALRAHLLTP